MESATGTLFVREIGLPLALSSERRDQRLLYHRHNGGAVPLRVLVKTAITVVTPPVVFFFIVFHYPSHSFLLRGAAEPQRCHCGHGDPMGLQLPFDGGATAIIGDMTAVFAATLRGQ